MYGEISDGSCLQIVYYHKVGHRVGHLVGIVHCRRVGIVGGRGRISPKGRTLKNLKQRKR